MCTDIRTGVTTEQMTRVVIRDVEARPLRMDEPLIHLATDALLVAWPCKK